MTAPRRIDHRKALANALKEYESVIERIYACAPAHAVGSSVFSECLKLSPTQLRAEHDAAVALVVSAEHSAVTAGKGYYSKAGTFMWTPRRIKTIRNSNKKA